ncbi:MAG: hypothetical protein AAF391_11820, partial [Bacteroidota bacterium]
MNLLAKYLVTSFFLVIATTYLLGQRVNIPKEGIPRITEMGHNEQVWTVATDSANLLYTGTGGGLYQRDGNNINHLYSRGAIRTIVKDAAEQIFVGGANTFGYIGLDSLGRKIYVPLNEDFENPGTIEYIVFHKDLVYFLFNNGFYRYNKSTQSVDLIEDTGLVKTGFEHIDNFLFCSTDSGIFKIQDNDSIAYVFPDLSIEKTVPADNQSVWAFSNQNGCYLFRPDGSMQPVDIPIGEIIKENKFYDVKRLNESLIAFLFLDYGLILTNNDLEILTHWDASSGLSNEIYDVATDRAGNLFVSSNDRLYVLNTAATYSIINDKLGLEGLVKDAVEMDGKLYAATYKGIYYKRWGDTTEQNSSYHQFRKMEKSSLYTYDLLKVDEDILVNDYQAIGLIRNDKYTRLVDKFSQLGFVIFSPDSSKVFSTGDDGKEIVVLEKQGKNWRVVSRIPTGELYTQFNITSSVIWDHKRNWFWMGTAYNELYSFKIDSTFSQIVDVRKYGEEDGLNGKVSVRKIDNEYLFLTSTVIHKYDDSSGKFVPDERLGKNAIDLYQLKKIKDDYWFASRSIGRGVYKQNGNSFEKK